TADQPAPTDGGALGLGGQRGTVVRCGVHALFHGHVQVPPRRRLSLTVASGWASQPRPPPKYVLGYGRRTLPGGRPDHRTAGGDGPRPGPGRQVPWTAVRPGFGLGVLPGGPRRSRAGPGCPAGDRPAAGRGGGPAQRSAGI